MRVKLINKSHHPAPHYATSGAAGMDIRANLSEPIVLEPLERCLVPTGLFLEIPEGYEAQIRPRSGLALKHGITLPNSPGTIDSDYRGELKILMINLSKEPFTFNDGERIAQMVVARHEVVEWELVTELNENTARGTGRFWPHGPRLVHPPSHQRSTPASLMEVGAFSYQFKEGGAYCFHHKRLEAAESGSVVSTACSMSSGR